MNGDADTWPLPEFRHLPGINARPAGATLRDIAALAPKPTLSATAKCNRVWRYGLRLIESGYYWEAHEVLEAVWLNAMPNSRERHLVQGVIQLANAALKSEMGRNRAAKRLALLSREALLRAMAGGGDRVMGVDIAKAVLAAGQIESSPESRHMFEIEFAL